MKSLQPCLDSRALPDPASVILAARNDGVALVVERTAENLVRVAFQNLHAPKDTHRKQPIVNEIYL